MKSRSPNLVLIAALLLVAAPAGAQIILDDDFDAAEVSGWIGQGNTRTFSAQNLSQAGSVITSEVVATQSNTNRGIVSTTSFEPAATGGFRMTFIADSVSTAPGANGYFVGLVRENDVFHRENTTKNFGLAFFGQDSRTASGGGFGLIYGDNNDAAASDFLLGNSDAQGDVELASFLDGYTASVSVDEGGWSYEITGLRNAAGTEMSFADTGSWGEAGTTFAALWRSGQPWFVTGGNQVVATTTHRIAFDRITVESPTPSVDTDGDGMPDDYEAANGTDIEVDDAAGDKDLDGLTNLQEFLGQNSSGESTGFGRTLSGTADSDGDTLSDGDELAGTQNPWFNGRLGVAPGDPTNPNSANSDGEGGNDAMEIANGTDPNAPPANTGPTFTFTDTDGDGYSDEAEIAFGSDPNDRNACPDHTPPAAKPNVVIIYADDLGFGDISAYGDFYGTPPPTTTPQCRRPRRRWRDVHPGALQQRRLHPEPLRPAHREIQLARIQRHHQSLRRADGWPGGPASIRCHHRGVFEDPGLRHRRLW